MTRMYTVTGVKRAFRMVKSAFWRCVTAGFDVATALAGCSDLVAEDLEAWFDNINVSERWEITILPEWRTLVLYRLSKGRAIGNLVGRFICLFVGHEKTLKINSESVGGGFFIQHGHGTRISAVRVGRRCWVNQNVSIGHSDEGVVKSLGDNVRVAVGAVVLGPISIGNDVVIGANAVVLRDVPDGLTVVGVPTHHYGQHKQALARRSAQ